MFEFGEFVIRYAYAILDFQIKQKLLFDVRFYLHIHKYTPLTSVFAIVQNFLFTVFWYLLQ